MNTPASASSLKIAVLGAGKIGSTIAFQLARGGNDVAVVARPGSERLQQLLRDRGIIDISGQRAEVRVTDALNEEAVYDLVIVTLLEHQTAAVMPSLQRSAARCMQFMFNTFRPENLIAAVGAERCTFGMAFVQAVFDPEGRIKPTIGAGGQKTIMSEQRWADVFNASGLPAVVEPDMQQWLRCHAPMCVAFESVAVAAERRGSGASWAEAMVLARGVHASFALIKALGYPVYPTAKKMIDGSPVPVLAATLWSLSRVASFREVLATGRIECAHLVDQILASVPAALRPIDVNRIRAMKPR